MISIYTSCFNIEKNNFHHWKYTIPKWLEFINSDDEIVIAVNRSDDDTLKLIRQFPVKIIRTEFDYNDYAFDGKIKNAALQECENHLCVGLDLDEVPSKNRDRWVVFGNGLLHSSLDFILIPVVDLCKSEKTAKGIGCKWYIHKRGLYRGVWNGAKLANGKIDIDKSDTCELIDKNGNLVRGGRVCSLNSQSIKNIDSPYVIHYGWLNWEDRQNQNEFWKPVWENRKGGEVLNITQDKDIYDSIEVFEHGLEI